MRGYKMRAGKTLLLACGAPLGLAPRLVAAPLRTAPCLPPLVNLPCLTTAIAFILLLQHPVLRGHFHSHG